MVDGWWAEEFQTTGIMELEYYNYSVGTLLENFSVSAMDNYFWEVESETANLTSPYEQNGD